MSDLSVVWQKSAQWENKTLRAGVTHCLLPPLDICTPLTAMTPMTCSSWPVRSSLLQLEVPVGPGL